jgi:hypothetical protein
MWEGVEELEAWQEMLVYALQCAAYTLHLVVTESHRQVKYVNFLLIAVIFLMVR